MTPAQTAADQFTHRRAAAARRVAEGRWSPTEAEARLRPWLHIAAMAHAQLDLCTEEFTVIFPYAGAQAAAGDSTDKRPRAGEAVRIPLALSLSQAERAAALAELAAARDAALDTVDRMVLGEDQPHQRALAQARALDRLARHLGAPPWQPVGRTPSTSELAPRAQAAAGDSAELVRA